MKKLLVYIHTLDEALPVLKYASVMAREFKMKLDLLYCHELHNFPMGIPSMERQVYTYTNEQTEKLFEEFERTAKEAIETVESNMENAPEMEYFARQGITTHVLSEFAGKGQYSYVLTLADQQNKFMINDRNLDIIQNVNCPVWIVPLNAVFNPISNIIYATDYHQEDIETMKKISVLARQYDARITGLHVTESVDFNEKVRNAGFKDVITQKVGYGKIDMTTIRQENGKSLSETINEFARLAKANLIVLLKENKGFFKQLFGKSETREIIGHAKIPVLVYQESE